MPKRNQRRRTHKMRGGYRSNMGFTENSATFSQSPNGEGANSWVEGKYGNTNQQYNDVFAAGSQTLGNTFTKLPLDQTPTPESLKLIQSAGGKRRRRAGMGFASAAATAAVPLSLLYLQNKYGKRTRRKRFTFRKKRGGKHNSRKGRGGTLAGVLSTAIVPFGLLGLQNRYGKRSKTAKRRKYRR